MSSPQTILAIDPGPEESAWVLMSFDGAIVTCGHFSNVELVAMVEAYVGTRNLAIEDIRCYGMAVGQETLDTCKWIGEFRHANNRQVDEIPRLTVKTTLCKTAKATDANVRQALIDMYGGSKKVAVGTKKKPGPLYGVKKHIWSALAVGVTYLEMRKLEPADAE